MLQNTFLSLLLTSSSSLSSLSRRRWAAVTFSKYCFSACFSLKIMRNEDRFVLLTSACFWEWHENWCDDCEWFWHLIQSIACSRTHSPIILPPSLALVIRSGGPVHTLCTQLSLARCVYFFSTFSLLVLCFNEHYCRDFVCS